MAGLAAGLALGLAGGALLAHALVGAITSPAGFALLVLAAGLVLGACTHGAVRACDRSAVRPAA